MALQANIQASYARRRAVVAGNAQWARRQGVLLKFNEKMAGMTVLT